MKLQKLALVIAVSAASPAFAAVGNIATLVEKFVTTPAPTIGNYTNIAINDVATQASNVSITQKPLSDAALTTLAGATSSILQTPIGLSIGSLGTNALSEINTNGIGSVNSGSVSADAFKLTPLVTGTTGGKTELSIDQSIKGNVAAVGGISATAGDKTDTIKATTDNGSLAFNAAGLTVTAGTQTKVDVPSSLAGTSLTNLSYNLATIDASVLAEGAGSVAVNNLKVSTNAIGAVNSGSITVKGI